MSDYFTHLARRTLGIAAGSDARPIRSARALIDAPRPALFPDEAESAPVHASVATQNTPQEAALHPHSVDAARAQRSRSRSVEHTQADALSGSTDSDHVLSASDVASTSDVVSSSDTASAFDAEGSVSPAVSNLQDFVPSAPQRVQAVASQQGMTVATADASLPGLDAARDAADDPHADSAKQSDTEVARSESAGLITESLGEIPAASIRTVEGEPSGALDPTTLSQDVPDSHRVDGASSKRASVSTQVTDAAAHKKAFAQNASGVVPAESEPASVLPLSSPKVARSDVERQRTEIATEEMIQTKSDAKTWTSEPLADTPSGSLRMGSSTQKVTAPQVHIHIGRIEVRSPQVMQPHRQTASAESRPTLSLASVLSMAKGK